MFTVSNQKVRFTREVRRRRRLTLSISLTMELVPEEKLAVITSEKPILSPRNENGDFDVDSSLEIELALINKYQLVVPGEKYPQVSENMTEADFQN